MKYFNVLLLLSPLLLYSSQHTDNPLNEALVAAIADGNLDQSIALLDKGAYLNNKNGNFTPLEQACFSGQRAIAQELVKRGAIVTNYCQVPEQEQTILLNTLAHCGLSVTNTGTLTYLQNHKKRTLQCSQLYFLRHGDTSATEKKIFTDKDTECAFLTAKGKTEIEMIADRIVELNPDVIISSTLTRCQETLDIVLNKIKQMSHSNHLKIVSLNNIRGINHGAWEGKNKDQLYGTDLLTWFAKWNGYTFARAPEGESLAEVLVRANALLNYIDTNFSNKKVLIIGHGSISWALMVLLGLYADPAKNDYHIQYGELKKMF